MSEVETEPIIEAKGLDATIRLYDGYVEIERKSLLGRFGSSKSERIPIDEITNIKRRNPGTVRSGLLKLLPRNVDDNDITTSSVNYSVKYSKQQRETFERIEQHVLDARS